METKKVSKGGRKKTLGQQELYCYVTRSIFNEKLKCKGDVWLRNIDITMEDPKTVRKVRRIIEKKMCQTYHNNTKALFTGVATKVVTI